MQMVVPLMLHIPKDQYCLHDYELHDQKFKTKCYLWLYCAQWIQRVIHHFYYGAAVTFFMVEGGGGGLSKNVGHYGWLTVKI